MRIIIDACSAILLAKASVFEKVLDSYNVIMPQEVYDEVIKGKEKLFADALLVERLKKENKIKVVKVNQKLKNKIRKDFNMGDGESSVLSSALEGNLIVFTDNRQGRKAAATNSIPLIGSPEIMVSLYKKKIIDYDKIINALKIIDEQGWFENYILEKIREDLKNVGS